MPIDIQTLYAEFLNSNGVSTDTRNIQKGDIYFALKGPSFNGNAFAEEALKKGAALAVIDEPEFQKGNQYFLVDDVLEALQLLSRYHRRQFSGTVIALTGSNGKTTTKELIKAVLSTSYNTIATKGNLNNHIGVPLTLLSIKPDTQIAIVEMGANHLGEIARLCEIAEPDAGLITNIGKAHIGTFGGFENILRAKSELYDYLIRNEGEIWVNEGEELLYNMSKRMKHPLLYPGKESFMPVEFVSADPFVKYSCKGLEGNSSLIGQYNFNNIATALAVGKYFKVEENTAMEAIAAYIPDNNRSQIIEVGSNTLIMDAYNANPSSMSLALENFSRMKSGKIKICILGDMFELGQEAEKEHHSIIKKVQKLGLRAIYVGENFFQHREEDLDGIYFKSTADIRKYLEGLRFSDRIFLIKGSRGMRLETLLEEFQA